MNAAARAAVRLGLDRGHTMLGVHGSFRGLIDGDVQRAALGRRRGLDRPRRRGAGHQPARADGQGPVRDRPRPGAARASTALLIIGGWDAFEAAHTCTRERERYPAFQIPMICLPATIDNNMPELRAVGRRRQRAEPDRRLDRPGPAGRHRVPALLRRRDDGRLLRLPGAAGRAVRRRGAGLPARGGHHAQGPGRTTSSGWCDSFRVGQRLFLTVMNEKASPMYTSDFLCRLFEQESQGLFDAREVVLGQTQQGGAPVAVRPDPRHPAGRALHRLARQPDRHASAATAP